MRNPNIAGIVVYKREYNVGLGAWANHASDTRGHFAQFSLPAFMPPDVPRRTAVAHNYRSGTIRGMHYQKRLTDYSGQGGYPSRKYGKVALVVSGVVFDVAVDMREKSPTYLDWIGYSLSEGEMIVLPPGVAHGYMTLTHGACLTYLLFDDKPDDEGVRWDDPKVGIEWPMPEPSLISDKDMNWRLL